MSDIRARLADALERELDEHDYEDDGEKRGQVAHHFADVLLSLDGIAVVELPKAKSGPREDGVTALFEYGQESLSVWDEEPPISLPSGEDISTLDARQYAAALLAAASAAEQQGAVQ